jgi:hypothetical protein
MQLDPLQLDGGIADIDVNFDSTAPSGTEIKFEVQLAGAWRALDEFEHTVLNGLPPLLPFRVVLLGTTDVMPGFGVSSKSQVLTERSRVDFKHISTVRALPSSCDTVEVTLRLVDFDPIIHTCVVKVLTGGGYTTVETADATVDEETPDPSVTIRRCTFNLAGAVSSYKIQIEGDTDNVLLTYTVAERYDLAFA